MPALCRTQGLSRSTEALKSPRSILPRIEKTPVRLTQILLTLSICSLAAALLPLGTIAAQAGAGDKQPEKGPSLPSEIPDSFTRAVGSFDFIRRDEQIPMRDGVTLHTVILIPKSSYRIPSALTKNEPLVLV